MPVKIEGSADGRTSLASLAVQPSRSTRPTYRRSRSIDATPTAVLISVGHSEHSMTVKAEMTKLLAKTGSTPVIVADTTLVTIGSKARRLDRNSVVEGKSGAVCVDLGGRRNIRKKNNNT